MQPFESKVLVSPFASFRKDLVPDGGSLGVDANGMLTLTRGEDNETLIHKPISELKSIQFGSQESYRGTNSETGVRIYVGPNEAYQVRFMPANNQSYESAVNARRNFFKGNFKDLKANLQEQAESQERSKLTWSSDVQEVIENREKFIGLAKQAGVYHEYRNTLKAVKTTIAILLIIGALLTFLIMDIRNK